MHSIFFESRSILCKIIVKVIVVDKLSNNFSILVLYCFYHNLLPGDKNLQFFNHQVLMFLNFFRHSFGRDFWYSNYSEIFLMTIKVPIDAIMTNLTFLYVKVVERTIFESTDVMLVRMKL